jgi:uncharacterized protein YfaP (DUF2135 family)
MTTDFRPFAKAIRANFDELSKRELYTVNISGDELWDFYLDSFPAGTNEMFRQRREYDCSCCKNFMRNVANVVAIVDNQLVSVWDIADAGHPFNVVCEALSEKVKSLGVSNVFRTKENSFGAEMTREFGDGTNINWNHFNTKIASKHICAEVATIKGKKATAAQVFRRALEELDNRAVTTVQELIKDDLLYRGMEHKAAVDAFAKVQREYNKLNSDEARSIFIWANIDSFVAGFRNTVIGTLVQDLTEGKDLEKAVSSFETKMAGDNYKRSKTLITPSMIKDAMKTIEALNLETALERRFARIGDVTVNNVLWVDNSVKGKMKGGIESLLMEAAVTKAPNVDRAENIGIEAFMADVVPKAKSIEALVKNAFAGNFMSLTAPVHDDVEQLFKWNNNFGWSYDGDIADSDIKMRVSKAGGNVTNAVLRISLAWFNFDDLDIHVFEPSGRQISFRNKDGKLDVDMNAGGSNTRQPVENVSYTKANIQNGVYTVKINQFRVREDKDFGFDLEVENNGSIHNFNYTKRVTGTVNALRITVKDGVVVNIEAGAGITGGMTPQEKWGVKTETLVPVDTIILSPNYWDDNATGNKHWFFILKNCLNPEPTRGIYNEFLRSGLEQHRKVFEVLGSKTKCESSDDQLSGIGFSSTKRAELPVLVKASTGQKLYNINF